MVQFKLFYWVVSRYLYIPASLDVQGDRTKTTAQGQAGARLATRGGRGPSVSTSLAIGLRIWGLDIIVFMISILSLCISFSHTIL